MVQLRKGLVFLVLVALLAAGLPITAAQDGEIESVCLVTDVGRVNDGTFNQFAYEGMLQAAEEFDLDTTFIETTAQTDYAANIDTCVQEGFDIIVTVGFLIGDATREAALANPDTYFIGVDQDLEFMKFLEFEVPENFVGIQYREDQGGFLVGVMAALVTESDIVAGVYGLETVPAVVKFRSGYEQGIAFVNEVTGSEVEALGVYIDDFVAPDRGASAANQFMGEGADVIFGAGGPTGSGGIQEAAQNDVWVIGVDQDEWVTTFGSGESPGSEFIFTSAIKRVDVGVIDMIRALVEGGEDFPGSSNYILDVASGGITFAEAHEADIPEEIYEAAAAVQQLLIDGNITTGVDPASGELTDDIADILDGADLMGLELPE